jgi:hypothetical protein
MPKSRISSRRKTLKKVPLQLSVKLPPKNVREKFLIIYELEGCQKAVNFLTEYYEVRKMKIVLNGKKVGNNYLGAYQKNTACFNKDGLNKRIVLHELYHHLIEVRSIEIPLRTEEKEANNYAKSFLKNKKSI